FVKSSREKSRGFVPAVFMLFPIRSGGRGIWTRLEAHSADISDCPSLASALAAMIWQKPIQFLQFETADGPSGEKTPGQNQADEVRIALHLKATNKRQRHR